MADDMAEINQGRAKFMVPSVPLIQQPITLEL